MKKTLLFAALACMTYGAVAQTEYMSVTKTDGTSINVKIADLDSVSFITLTGEPLGSYTENGLNIDNYDLEINPITKVPSVFYFCDDQKGSLVNVESSAWTAVGDKGFTESAPYDAASLAFDSIGVPYVFYVDAAKFGRVMKYTENAWDTVGTHFGTTSVITAMVDGLALDADNNPLAGYMLSKAVGAIARRTLVVSYFDGDDWLAEKTISGIAATDYLVSVFKAGSTVYCGFIQQGVGGSYKLYKYDGEFAWTKVCDFLPTGATQPNVAGVEWAVSDDGNTVYLLAGSDAITNSIWFPTVFRYKVDTDKWTQVGDPLPSAGGEANKTMQSSCRFDLVIDSKGDPMVLYKDYDNNSYATVRTLNAESRQWNAPVVIDNYTLSADKIMLKSIEAGVQYAAYIKQVNGVDQVTVVKLNY